MLYLKDFTLSLLFSLSAATVVAQDRILTLEQTIELSLANNNAYRAGALTIQEREELAKSNFELDKTQVYYGYDQANLGSNDHPLSTFGVSQTIQFPTVFAERNRAQDMEVTMARLDWDKQKQLLEKDVSSVYYQIQYLYAKLDLYNRIDSLYYILTSSSETRYRMGDISQLNMMNAQAKYKQATLMTAQLKFDIDQSYQRLQALTQTEQPFTVARQPFTIIPINLPDFANNIDIESLRLRSKYLKSKIKIEKQRLLPDLSLNYFYSTNFNRNRRGYHGFEIGVSFPLYTGEQRSNVRAGKMAWSANEAMINNSKILIESKFRRLESELNKHRTAIDFYMKTGKQLSEEIICSATKSYNAGAIDFYQFAESMENAIQLQLDYYQALAEYNQVALEINYIML